MASRGSTQAPDRVAERRRGVALARHFRDSEGMTIAQIADRLGRAPATVKAYFYDPTGEKARAVKARYVGVCRGCGAYTQPRNGKGDAYAYCKTCHPGAIKRRWTRELVISAMREWRERYGRLPSSYDWSRARGRGARAAGCRRMAGCERGRSPVRDVGCRANGGIQRAHRGITERGLEGLGSIGHTGDLCAQSLGIARKIRGSEELPGVG